MVLDMQVQKPGCMQAACAAAGLLLSSGWLTGMHSCSYAAAFKPVILLPGINHGHMSNGEARTKMGDLNADVPLQQASDDIAENIVRFLSVHGSGLTDKYVAYWPVLASLISLLNCVGQVDCSRVVSPCTACPGLFD